MMGAAAFKPHAYQKYAIDRMLRQEHLALFLDMGLGKTVITLTALDTLINDNLVIGKALVIAPKRVAQHTWTAEARKWAHLKDLRLSVVVGGLKARIKALNATADIFIINREMVVWLCEYYNWQLPFDCLVIDEASSFKDSATKRFKALRRVAPGFKRVYELTGTPAANSLMDLWAQIYLLDQGKALGKFLTTYKLNYFTPGARSGYIVYNYVAQPGAKEAIYKAIEPIAFSMAAKDWLELPKRIDNRVQVKLSDAAMAKYKELERFYILQLTEDREITAGSAAVLCNKLLQLANGAAYDADRNVTEIHQEKLDALEEIIEAAAGKPVLVFYSYIFDRQRIKERLPQAVTIDAKGAIDDWNAGKVPVLLAHPASAGYGLNLQQGGHVIVWYGLTWSLEQYEQANARLYRQGQTEAVIINHIVAEGTMDESVLSALENKSLGQQALLSAVKAKAEEVLANGGQS